LERTGQAAGGGIRYSFLGQIPLVQSIREGGDSGVPIMMSEDPIAKKAFLDFAGKCSPLHCDAECKYGVAKVTERIEGYERSQAE